MTIKKAVGVFVVSCIIMLSSCNSSNQGKSDGYLLFFVPPLER